ncbi:DUF4910 domain-containing protein [Methanospirillum stamsii]|uniref:Aminopeptidase n=1 Tax=Methanospirillum stamsii TaxID=1277351 RepID=A0A2V2N2D6_9EURY|nr:DUF4910 domain-containing protein [Methanospirillum stamsii]PWR69621.1 aminopeptidase [Methanospirillum stamsii]
MTLNDVGQEMYNLCHSLFPICRSITGDGVRQTLKNIKEHIPEIIIHEVPTGTRVFDWVVPREWNIRDAYILDPDGQKIIDFTESNLHVVGYSVPVNKTVSLKELQNHLYSIPDQPDAIPYITSYYAERWGFCLSEIQRRLLKPGDYHVVIDSTLTDGSLTYGELLIPGESSKEVFLSTYICHPSMANNELSGPVVTTYLSKWLLSLMNRKYSYRIVFIPETIGSITYLSRNLDHIKQKTIAGFNVTCIGDNKAYSYLPSREGSTLADRVALHVLKYLHPDFVQYSYLERGSDERQYCSPGVDLPVASVMRTKYGRYPEYHTSLDDLSLVSPEGLAGGYEVLRTCLECIERNEILETTLLCEPQLGRRGLYPTLSTKDGGKQVRNMMNLIAFCDGMNDLIQIAEKINVPIWDLFDIVERLKQEGVLKTVSPDF